MLTDEDTLKVNVLIATSIAIRIDMYKNVVVGLSKENKEQTVKLNPDSDSTKYIQEVQALLVSKVLGTMGGYPSYLKRWSRMGQVSSANLKSLLMIGNIEAVVAVANSNNLDSETCELVWWCATNTDHQAEVGMFLLNRDFVVKHPVGTKIADFLLEFLPFTTDILNQIDTTNLILQGSLISDSDKDKLWKQGQRKTAILVGFIERMQGRLPNTNNTFELKCGEPMLDPACSLQGQILLKTIQHILNKINQEYVLYRTLEVLGQFLSHPKIYKLETIDQLQEQSKNFIEGFEFGTTKTKVESLLLLAGVSELLVVGTISAHGLAGSAIRKKLSNVLTPIQDALVLLTAPQ